MLRPLLASFGALALLTGLVYPLALTGLAQVLFPQQASGSLIWVGGQIRGSRLVAQATEDPRYFWCRPSATAAFPTHAGASGGSCLAPSNPALAQAVAVRVAALRASDPGNGEPIPQDLVTASASGLDPHISLEGAQWQVRRVARLRGLSPRDVEGLIARRAVRSALGPTRVNVLELNRALDSELGR